MKHWIKFSLASLLITASLCESAFALNPIWLSNLGTVATGSTNAGKDSLDVNITGGVALSATPINANGSGSGAAATVSTAATITAPANAVGFILMNLDTSTTNMRWAIGRTASVTLGQQLQPGRSSDFVPCGANVSIIAESGTVNYDIQWVSQ